MTASSLPTTSYALMGLLSLQPMSGYDLSRFVEDSIAHFWPISKSQVYAELDRLEDRGFIEGTAIPQDKLPDKRTYELTESGGEAFAAWVDDPTYEEGRSRSGFLVKMFFAHRMSAASVRELVDRVRSDSEAARERFTEIIETLSMSPASAYMRATALLGLRTAEACLTWADELEEELPALRQEGSP